MVNLNLLLAHCINSFPGPDNSYITEGPHASAFSARAGKTHYLGQPIPSGHIWQARDSILQTMIKRAQDAIAPYADPAVGLPDPSFILQLPDEVYSGSNLYAVQKTFTGPFQFDVFFDSASATQKLTCQFSLLCNICEALTCL